MCPSRTREVTPATAVRVVNDSKVISSVVSGVAWKWPKSQAESKTSNAPASPQIASSVAQSTR